MRALVPFGMLPGTSANAAAHSCGGAVAQREAGQRTALF
jgi:hypothetical protein